VGKNKLAPGAADRTIGAGSVTANNTEMGKKIWANGRVSESDVERHKKADQKRWKARGVDIVGLPS